MVLPHSAPSWILSQAENLASSNLQDGATKWHYYLNSYHIACATDPPHSLRNRPIVLVVTNIFDLVWCPHLSLNIWSETPIGMCGVPTLLWTCKHIFATLGSILDSQFSWESCKFQLARWSQNWHYNHWKSQQAIKQPILNLSLWTSEHNFMYSVTLWFWIVFDIPTDSEKCTVSPPVLMSGVPVPIPILELYFVSQLQI